MHTHVSYKHVLNVHIVLLQGFTLEGSDTANLPHLFGHNPEGEKNKLSETNASRTQQWLTQSALPHTVQYTLCYSCQLPSRMNVSKCFSKIFLPFSMIWMASNVTDPLKEGFVLKCIGHWVCYDYICKYIELWCNPTIIMNLMFC